MKTLLKRITVICLLVIATVCLGLFAACGDGDNNTETDNVTYTVTVTDDTDAPVKGAGVSLTKGAAFYSATTGDDGKASFTLPSDTYTVTLSKLPEGYSVPDGTVTVTKDNPNASIKLTKDFRYTVKLVDEDGKPFYLPNVYVAICVIDGNCLTPHAIGEDGSWTMTDVTPGDYKVQIIFPEAITSRYTFEGKTASSNYYSGEHFSATKTEMTIVITDLNAASAYTVTVLNPDSTPAQNVYVSLSTGTSELAPVKTGADGKAKITVTAYGEYFVKVNAPEGCVYNSGIKTTASNHNLTVQLYTLNDLSLETEMTSAEVTAYGLSTNAFPAYHSFTHNFKANETKYFSFTPYNSGNYAIYCIGANAAFRVCSDGTNFTDAEDYPVGTFMATAINGTKNKSIYFSIKANAAGQIRFVVAGPDKGAVSSSVTFTAEGTKEITVISAENYATVNLTPSVTGKYEITSEGNYDTKIECYATNGIKFDEDDNSGEGNNFKYTAVVEVVSTTTATYRIYVKSGAAFPATFNIKVTRTGDIEISEGPEEVNVQATEIGDTAYAGTGLFEYVDLSVAQTAVLGTDGYYHLGTAEGPVLVAKLAQNFRNFGVFTTENPSEGGRAAIPYFVIIKTFDNGEPTGIYNYIEFLTAYSAKCNIDGVYPVNGEIKLLLERWSALNINEHTFGIEALGTIAKGNEWLIPCGYYVESSLTGDGTELNAYALKVGSFNIDLTANTPVFFTVPQNLSGKYTVTVLSDATLEIERTALAPISVSEIEGGYTLDCEADYGFKITASAAASIVLRFNEKAGNVLETGDNEITVAATDYFDGVTYTFTAAESGEYVISSADANAAILATNKNDEDINHVFTGTADGQTLIEGGFSVRFTAEAGVEYTVLFSSVDFNGGTYTVTVSAAE